MFLGILQFELAIPWARSLKDKRSVVKSLKDRLHREHLVSIAETSALDAHQTAILGLAVVSNSGAYCSQVLDRVLRKVDATPDCELVDHQRDIIRGADVPDELYVDERLFGADRDTHEHDDNPGAAPEAAA